MPACTTANGCFKKLNQKGQQKNYPAQNVGWAQESALDVDMASAMCPNCQIWLVEANTNSFKNLAAAVDTAAELGAHVISNSYSGGDSKGAMKFEPSYDHPGIAITASSGDAGYGTGDPGGDAACDRGRRHASRPRHQRSRMGGDGLGRRRQRLFEVLRQAELAVRQGLQDAHGSGCFRRCGSGEPALLYIGPHANGISGWLVFGGTSVSAPMIGGIFGANGGTVNDAETLYDNSGAFYDVTIGQQRNMQPANKAYFCNGEVGYDGPTGLGTPNGTTRVRQLGRRNQRDNKTPPGDRRGFRFRRA